MKFAWGKAALLIFLLLLSANVLLLDFVLFIRQGHERETLGTSEVNQTQGSEPEPASPAGGSEVGRKEAEINFCPAACLTLISEATASALAQITPVSLPTPILITSEPMVKEVYIPLGQGSTSSKEWVEMMGVEAVVDMANFPNVSSMILEASMRIPTANGKIYTKLFNVTDGHDVWYSEVWAEGSGGYRAESAEITLSSGRKLYRVMMKSTMGYEAVLDSARIKILLK